MFVFLTLLSIPAYIFYYSGTESNDGSGDMKSFLGKLSLGNIGQSAYACNSATTFGNDKFNLYCGYGTLSEIVEFGQSLKSSESSCKSDGSGLKFTPKTCSYNDGFNETTI